MDTGRATTTPTHPERRYRPAVSKPPRQTPPAGFHRILTEREAPYSAVHRASARASGMSQSEIDNFRSTVLTRSLHPPRGQVIEGLGIPPKHSSEVENQYGTSRRETSRSLISDPQQSGVMWAAGSQGTRHFWTRAPDIRGQKAHLARDTQYKTQTHTGPRGPRSQNGPAFSLNRPDRTPQAAPIPRPVSFREHISGFVV